MTGIGGGYVVESFVAVTLAIGSWVRSPLPRSRDIAMVVNTASRKNVCTVSAASNTTMSVRTKRSLADDGSFGIRSGSGDIRSPHSITHGTQFGTLRAKF